MQVDFAKELGKGAWTIVHQGKFDGRPAAIKMARSDERELRKEIGILQSLSHDNIVHFYGDCSKDGKLLEVLELCAKGSLEGVVKHEPAALTVWRRCRMAIDMTSGICYLHHQGVYHGDLKLANVLVKEDFTCKLADFNLSKFRPAGQDTFAARGGTMLYASPEVSQGKPVSLASDIYSLGLCLFEILTLANYASLVSGMGGRDLLSWLSKGRMKVDLNLKAWPSEFIPLQEVVKQCTAFSPSQRPLASDILAALQGLDPVILEARASAAASSSSSSSSFSPVARPPEMAGKLSTSTGSASSSSSSPALKTFPQFQGFLAHRSERTQPQQQPQGQVGQFAMIRDRSHPGYGCIALLKQWDATSGKWTRWPPTKGLATTVQLAPCEEFPTARAAPMSLPEAIEEKAAGRWLSRKCCRTMQD